jgi:NAD(P)-dependent dehydrogenase (short-subunit alcohol dehydrogenase family)
MTSRPVAFLISLILLFSCSLSAETSLAAESEPQKAVLVTGASSGIGRNIAERLAREGYFVYAGARKAGDLKALSAIHNMQGVRLDVTVQAEIDAAVETVSAGGLGLHGIVNNAGVVSMGILAEIEESELDFIFDVNVYGPYRIVKAFAPLVIASQGRIANISSMAGITAPPAYGVYSMSKFALEAYSASLAFEMDSVGVKVSVIEPGPYKSKAIAANCRRSQARDFDPAKSQFTELAAQLATLCQDDAESPFPEPDIVADAVLHALFAEEPNYRYLAVSERGQAEYLLQSEFRSIADLSSNGHAFKFTRAELIDMLDAAITD